MCMGRFRRWYYDAAEEECKEFFFRGCSGNGNNFESKDQCERLCGKRYGKDSWQLRDENPFNGLESSSLIRLEEGQEYRPGYDTPPCQKGETPTYPERFVSGCKTLSLK